MNTLEEAFLDSLASRFAIEDAAEAKAAVNPRTGQPFPTGVSLEPAMGAVAETVGAGAKGAAQGFAGLPGDLIALARGVYELGKSGGDLDAFVAGLESKTGLPTTEDIKKFLDEAGLQMGSGESLAETVGELAAPGGYVKGAKKVAGKVKEVLQTPPRGSISFAPKELPRVDSIERLPIGPGSIKPVVIAEGKPLFRETNASSVSEFLRMERQFDTPRVYVTDNKDLALGQGQNVGVMVQFRPNSLSGKINPKPGTRPETGMEYMTDVVAPKAIEKITFNSVKDLKGLDAIAKRTLSREFDKQELDGGQVMFTRKGSK